MHYIQRYCVYISKACPVDISIAFLVRIYLKSLAGVLLTFLYTSVCLRVSVCTCVNVILYCKPHYALRVKCMEHNILYYVCVVRCVLECVKTTTFIDSLTKQVQLSETDTKNKQ